MKKIFASLLLLSTFIINAAAINAPYDIKIKVNGISNEDAILAYYYSDTKYIHDTLTFNANGEALIQDTATIPTGVYLLAFPSLNLTYFELVLGEEQSFSMETDTADLVGSMKVKNSLENKVFYDNLKYMVSVGEIAAKLRSELEGKEAESDEYKNIQSELVKIDDGIKTHRKKVVKEHPNLFYTKLIQMMMDVDLPENPNPSDSSFAYNYYQKHYFDMVDLTDDRLIRTPVLKNKIMRFLDYFTIPIPDSINLATDKILAETQDNYDMFQFTLSSIFNKYAKSNIMSHESVYVYLAEKYYADANLVDWVTEEQRDKIMDVVRRKKPTCLGCEAPNIIIQDYDTTVQKLHDVASQNDYTILVFWNSGCGHCKKEMPLLKEFYEDEIKQLGKIKIFAITTELEYDDWTNFIEENDLIQDGWIHAIDQYGQNIFRVKYDVQSTPIVIILDKDKKILAKKINIEDIKNLIEFDMSKE